MPVWPALSRAMTRLRVKKGACAPDRFSNMPSRPATGTTCRLAMRGEEERPTDCQSRSGLHIVSRGRPQEKPEVPARARATGVARMGLSSIAC